MNTDQRSSYQTVLSGETNKSDAAAKTAVFTYQPSSIPERLDLVISYQSHREGTATACPYGLEDLVTEGTDDEATHAHPQPDQLNFQSFWGDVVRDIKPYLTAYSASIARLDVNRLEVAQQIRRAAADRASLSGAIRESSKVSPGTGRADTAGSHSAVTLANLNVLKEEMKAHYEEMVFDFSEMINAELTALKAHGPTRSDTGIGRASQDRLMVGCVLTELSVADAQMNYDMAKQAWGPESTNPITKMASKILQEKKSLSALIHDCYDRDLPGVHEMSKRWASWRRENVTTASPSASRINFWSGMRRFSLLGAKLVVAEVDGTPVRFPEHPKGIDAFEFISKDGTVVLTSGLYRVAKLIGQSQTDVKGLHVDWLPRRSEQDKDVLSIPEFYRSIQVDASDNGVAAPHGKVVLDAAHKLKATIRSVQALSSGSAQDQSANAARLHSFERQKESLSAFAQQLVKEVWTERLGDLERIYSTLDAAIDWPSADERRWVRAMGLGLGQSAAATIRDLISARFVLDDRRDLLANETKRLDKAIATLRREQTLVLDSVRTREDWPTEFSEFLAHRQAARDEVQTEAHSSGKGKGKAKKIKIGSQRRKDLDQRFRQAMAASISEAGAVNTVTSTPHRLPPPTVKLYGDQIPPNARDATASSSTDAGFPSVRWSTSHQSWQIYVDGDVDALRTAAAEVQRTRADYQRLSSYRSNRGSDRSQWKYKPIRHAREARHIQIGSNHKIEPQPMTMPEKSQVRNPVMAEIPQRPNPVLLSEEAMKDLEDTKRRWKELGFMAP